MTERRILISLAHPDDESFGSGSLIAKYVREGADVYYICGTDGDRGTIPEEMQGRYDTVRELRLSELDCASEILGFKEVFKFHYKDSGMMNSETTKDPDCLWYHSQQPELFEKLVERIVTVIREIQPQVIVTFDPYGGYGHPDHIAMHHATVKAFDAAADPDYLPGTLPPYQPQKLYFTALPAGALRLMLFVTRLRGKDPRKMGTNEDIDFQAIVDHILPGHTRIDVRDYMEIGDRANACHASQGGGRSFGNFPGWLRRRVFGHQTLTRVHPAPSADKIDELDLFSGVTTAPMQEPVA